MYSQEIPSGEPTSNLSNKSKRSVHILTFIQFVFVSICLLLLLLNQYLNTVVDDYSPAYSTPDPDDQDEPNENFSAGELAYWRSPEEHPKIFEVLNISDIKIYPVVHSPKNLSKEIHTLKMRLQTTQTPMKYLPTENSTTFVTTEQLPTPHTLITHLPEKNKATHVILTNIIKTEPPTKNLTTLNLKIANNVRKSDREGPEGDGVIHDSDNNNSDVEKKKRRTAENVDLMTEISARTVKTDEATIQSDIKNSSNHPKILMNFVRKEMEAWIRFSKSNLSPEYALSRVKRERNNSQGNIKARHMKTKLSNLLILYPCTVTVMTILGMQLVSTLSNDLMHKTTTIVLTSACLGLGITIFTVSVLESVHQENAITIIIAVGSAIFIVLEIIDFILLFTRV